MNNHVFNTQVNHLLMAGYGKSGADGSFTPVITDHAGRIILSNHLDIETESDALDIRSLNETQDSALITISNLDIREFAGTRDNLKLSGRSFAEATESGVIVALSSRNFLPRDISAYQKNTFYVRNTSGLSVSVTINLQIAPADIDSYYTNDGSSFNLIGGNTAMFQPSKLMKYARIRVSALLLANITVYYFGQT